MLKWEVPKQYLKWEVVPDQLVEAEKPRLIIISYPEELDAREKLVWK